MLETKRFGCIQQHQIEVPAQAAMLKTIIKQQHLHVEFVDCNVRNRHSLTILQVRHVRQCKFQLQCFIIHAAGFCSVPTAENGDPQLLGPQLSREPFHHWRFTRPAEREDRRRQPPAG